MKINFHAHEAETDKFNDFPVPSKKAVPGWYKTMPRFAQNAKKFQFSQSPATNVTVKWCNPFYDSLSAGYMILLENDLSVTYSNGLPLIEWKFGGDNFITDHSIHQVPAEMIPEEFHKLPFKFKNSWSIKTPSGYSLLFTHPLNRPDLPFYTLSGFVDTDEYNTPVNLPFLIKEGFTGIIPAGTPIAQIIPIKREPWTNEIHEFNKDFSDRASNKIRKTIYRAYKNLFWKRKDYN